MPRSLDAAVATLLMAAAASISSRSIPTQKTALRVLLGLAREVVAAPMLMPAAAQNVAIACLGRAERQAEKRRNAAGFQVGPALTRAEWRQVAVMLAAAEHVPLVCRAVLAAQ